MLAYTLLLIALACPFTTGNFGPFQQDYGYVTVREGAHMFYWLFYTTADVPNYTDRPLIVWLQGGPGGSSTGIGNFEILGPLDLSLQERNTSWVKNFNVLFVDNPVGTGFSYVEANNYLTTSNDMIALDFVVLMQGFFNDHPEFNGVPLYIYGQSYGGKMAVDMGIRMKEAEAEGRIGSNLRGIAMGNAWIHPVDATLTWGPLLLAAGLVDQAGYENIQASAREAERLFNEGQYVASTQQWAATQGAVFQGTTSVDFYDILTKMPTYLGNTRQKMEDIDYYEMARETMIRDGSRSTTGRQEWNLNVLMNTVVKEALGIPQQVVWGSQSNAVFNFLNEDFMKPVTDGIEKLLNETDIIVMKYNGNLDLICDTPGQILWVDRLNWAGAEGYRNSPRHPIWENDRLEGYYKSYGNFRFFWINVAGHSVPLDFVVLMQGFFNDHPEFNGVPLYIYGQSYGGKMAVDMGIRMKEAEAEGRIGSNLRGIAMGNAWIHPVDATLTWGPLLLAAGLVDQAGYENIQASAREAERLFNEGQYVASTQQWAATQGAVFQGTTSVDFYDILTKMPTYLGNTRQKMEDIDYYEMARETMIRDGSRSTTGRQEWNLNVLMNTVVKEALGIPQQVVWGSQSNAVFNFLNEDFMKPVTDGIEKLLNETDIIVMKYNGNLDLICDTPGQILWVDRLNWAGAEGYRNSPRHPIWENDRLEGYYKSYGNFRFFWINVAGHSVPRDNPAGTNAFLRDMTSFG